MFFKIPEVCQRLFQDLLELIIPYGFSNLRDVASDDTGSETCEDEHSIGIMLAAEAQPPSSPAVHPLHAEGEPVCNDIGPLEETDLDSVPSAGTESTTIQLHVELASPSTLPLHSPHAAGELAPNKADSGTSDERQNTGAMSPAVNGLPRNTDSTSPSPAGDVYNGTISNGAAGGIGNTNYFASDRSQILVNHEAPKSPQEVPKALNDATAHAAFHNSDARVDPPRCHPNTRQAILDKIMNWIQGEDTTEESSVMWLYGPAGSGKTAIAQSIAERLEELKMLLASYFFGRLDSSRNYSRSLIATIAYQIALRLPDQVRERITDTVNRDPHVFNLSLEAQIKPLIADPLQPLIRTGYFTKKNAARVIIIDGLDECVNREQQVGILRSVSAALQKHQLPILFFIASRPELEIQGAFNSDLFQGVSTRLALDNDYQARKDIERLLSDEFKKIKRTRKIAWQIPADWPSRKAIQQLVQKSSGQFIYASTVVKFVKSIRHHPHKRLDIILGLRVPEKDLPFAELDALYCQLFSNVEDWEKVSLVLAFHVLQPSFQLYSRQQIETLLRLECGDIDRLFCDLGSIIELDKTGLPFHHASIPDFLLDKSRSGNFHIDPPAAHARLAQKLLQFFRNCQPVQLKTEDKYAIKIPGAKTKEAINLQLLSVHIERAAGSEELERDIRNFHFLRLFEPEFPCHAVYSIPEYISALEKSGPLLQRLPNEVNQQRGTFLTHIKEELKAYCQDLHFNFLLVCFHEGEYFAATTYRSKPRLRDTLRLQQTLQDCGDSYFSGFKSTTSKHIKYKEILQDIIKDVILDKNYTSAALYLLQKIFPGQRSIYWPLSGPEYLWRLLGKADCSEELISYIRNLPWQLMITVEYFPFEDFDVAAQDYFARIDIPFHQDYTSLALYALRKVSDDDAELPSNESGSSNQIRNCCYLLKKAGHSEELINCIQNLPWRFIIMEHWKAEDLDISVQNYLVRMNIPSNQDHASLALHALRKVSELFSNEFNVNWRNPLLRNSRYLLEKAGRSEELIDCVQHFPSERILGYETDTFARVDKAIQDYLERMNIVSDRDYTPFALHGLGKLSEVLLEQPRKWGFELGELSSNCVYLLEKAGRSAELIDLVQQLQLKLTSRPGHPPYWLLDTEETDKKNLHDAFVAYLRRTAPYGASTPTSQGLETHTVQSVNL